MDVYHLKLSLADIDRRNHQHQREYANYVQSGTGDESHFLLKCPILNDHRKDLLTAMADTNEIFTSLPDEDKVVLILESCASHPAVSNSIYHMYRERCNLLR